MKHMTKKAPWIQRAVLLILALILALGACPVSAEDEAEVPLPDFSLTDQYGRTWTKEDLQGRAVFLNFWATWCYWCVYEMPDIETLYHEYGENEDAVLVLGVASPGDQDTADEAGVADFLKEHGITYPVLMDTEGQLFRALPMEGYPTTFAVKSDGMILGMVTGAISLEDMRRVVEMTLNGIVE